MKTEKDLIGPEEVLSYLRPAVLNQTSAHIWSRDSEGNITLNARVEILEVKGDQELLIKTPEGVSLTQGMDILFALEGGTLVFKSQVLEIGESTLSFSIPKVAKGIERRRSPRVAFKFEEGIDFEIEIQDAVKTVGYLIDLSQHGMCLTISRDVMKDIRLNQKLKIVRGNKGITSQECIVRSIRAFHHDQIGSSVLFAVGFEFA
jgi:c-di-GMP-binding flagellar brake protein YcgR